MKVYVVLDNSRDCYDAGGIFHSVHATLESAQMELERYSPRDKALFDIYEETLEERR